MQPVVDHRGKFLATFGACKNLSTCKNLSMCLIPESFVTGESFPDVSVVAPVGGQCVNNFPMQGLAFIF